MADEILKSEIEKSVDSDLIAYSMLWEDHLVLEKALKIRSSDHVLSIASAGCNVLNLLLNEPQSITAIDFNTSQLNLLRLKIAGIRQLSHENFLVLLGLQEGDSWKSFEQLQEGLDPETYQWWLKNSSLIENGICFQGKLERYFQGLRKGLLQRCSESELNKLLSVNHLEDQKDLFQTIFTDDVRSYVEEYFEVEQKKSARDKEKFKYVEDEYLGGELWSRFERSMLQYKISDNFYNEYILFSKFKNPSKTQPYLDPRNFKRLGELVDRIEIIQGSVEEHLQSLDSQYYDKANMSDIFEYMSLEHTRKLLELISAKLNQGGRVAYWNLYNERSSQNKVKKLQIEENLSLKLHQQDRTWFYRRFFVECKL